MQKRLDATTGYARYAWEYDEKEKYWDSFEQDKMKPYIQEAKGLKVLDAGAGTGRLTGRLQALGADVTALDVSPDMLAILHQKYPEIETVVGDMEEMPFEDETFDMVFSSMALVHLKKLEPFLDEAYRVLKDNGKLVLLNIHYRKPMILQDGQGKYTIACYNHYPPHVVKAAKELAFGIEHEEILTEGNTIWISQLLVLKK